jgi:hypothetical protein
MSGVGLRPFRAVLATLPGWRGTGTLIALTLVVSVSVPASAATASPRYTPDPTLRTTVSEAFGKVEAAMRKWVACHSCERGAADVYAYSFIGMNRLDRLLDRRPRLSGRDRQAYAEAYKALQFHAAAATTVVLVRRTTDPKVRRKRLAQLRTQITSAHIHAVKAARLLGIRTAL